MSEEQGTYNTQGDNAAEIHPPKTIQVIQDKGLVEYRVWGWVKISAKFISHIKRLRGAKLSIWQVLACSIDENGKCSLTIKELCELTGYSHTEVLDSLKELDEMGYLSIDRSGKKNLYTPEFAARGIDRNPSETLVKKLDSTPVYQVESTPLLEKSASSIKELKELIPLSIENAIYAGVEVTKEMVQTDELRNLAPRMFEKALGFSKPLPWWNGKEWTAFGDWVCEQYAESKTAFGEYNIWRHTPYTKGGMANTRIRGFVTEFYDSWDMFKMSKKQPAEQSEYTRLL